MQAAIPAQLDVWKTITIGGYPTSAALLRALTIAGNRVIPPFAVEALQQLELRLSAEELTVDLVIRTAAELGFDDAVTIEQVYTRAKEIGLDLCPAEVGPQLRLQYSNQPRYEWLIIGMEPILDSRGDPLAFDLRQGDTCSGILDAYWDGSACVLNDSHHFVFVRPRPSL